MLVSTIYTPRVGPIMVYLRTSGYLSFLSSFHGRDWVIKIHQIKTLRSQLRYQTQLLISILCQKMFNSGICYFWFNQFSLSGSKSRPVLFNSSSCLYKYTVNVDIFGSINFREFAKIENFAWIYIHVFDNIASK